MKHLFKFFILLALTLLLTSCYDESYYDNNNDHHGDAIGYLKLVNNTDAIITVHFTADGSVYTLSANSFTTFEYDMRNTLTDPNGISTTYTCEGQYFHFATFTDYIYSGGTTSRVLDPDRGCIKFVNNTAGYVDVTIPGLDNPITISPNSHYVQAWIMEETSAVVPFSYTGDFVFTDDDHVTVNVNDVVTYSINATGAAIRVNNYTNASITEVYLSPHSDGGWGTNDLSGTIAPGHYVIWTVTPNNWDVKVVDAMNFFATWMNNGFIDFNQMMTINYSDKKDLPGKVTKKDGFGSAHIGSFKIQQNQRANNLIQ